MPETPPWWIGVTVPIFLSGVVAFLGAIGRYIVLGFTQSNQAFIEYLKAKDAEHTEERNQWRTELATHTGYSKDLFNEYSRHHAAELETQEQIIENGRKIIELLGRQKE